MLEALRREVAELHAELPKNGLVAWTSGNISGRDPDSGLVVIKPSGVKYRDLTPANMVIVGLDGRVVEGPLKPSTDCESHLFIYHERPDIGGVVHTHSPYATAFAAVGQDIPIVLTAMADEFGGPVPCSEYARIGGRAIGEEVVRMLGKHHCSAVLLKQHGVFTVGGSAEAAVKSAVMVEDVARTVFYARQLGDLEELPAEEIEIAHHRYMYDYGQR
ncbi:MAG TPA: L-ribulose-5-phosphate 4-epimerase [Stellaceae bacterium]|nr:L-ribulose-5-phosphate 4-epimerase [Stellaceae bacterium]